MMNVIITPPEVEFAASPTVRTADFGSEGGMMAELRLLSPFGMYGTVSINMPHKRTKNEQINKVPSGAVLG
jgi:hypothetical protein